MKYCNVTCHQGWLSPTLSVPACFEKHFIPKLLLLLLTVSETLVLFLKQEPCYGNAPVVY
jgi:hypothetical protein